MRSIVSRRPPFQRLILPFALAAALGLTACGGGAPAPTATATAGPSGGAGGPVSVELKSFLFVPDTYTFKTGETVQFKLTSTDIDHTFTVKELGIDWTVKPGTTMTQSVTLSQAGSFRLLCIIPGHEAAGMEGTFIVRAG